MSDNGPPACNHHIMPRRRPLRSLSRRADDIAERLRAKGLGMEDQGMSDEEAEEVSEHTWEELGDMMDEESTVGTPVIVEDDPAQAEEDPFDQDVFDRITEATKLDVADMISRYLYEAAKKYHGDAAQIQLGLAANTGMSPYAKAIVTEVKLNRNRIVLPEIITEISGLGQDDDIIVSAEKNCIVVTKSKPVKK